MEFHEVANIFPLMEGEPFKELCNDIAANGLIEPIWTWKDKIIDGRNRYRACMEIGIEPEYREFKGGDEGLLTFVLALNLKRRHLTSSQRAAAGLAVEEMLSKQAKKNQSVVGGDRKSPFQRIEKAVETPIRSAKQAAQMVGTNTQYIVDAKKVREADPRMFEQVVAGTLTLKDARRKLHREERLEELAVKTENNRPLNSIGRFNVIYADPPWQYDHPISDSRKIENQYPTMTNEDICALPVCDISQDDAIIFLWVTTPMLKKGLQVLEAWGFEYRTSMVWVKPSIGPGQWVRQRHEYLYIGVRGNIPTPEDKPDSVLEAPRQEHSKKPDEMYEIIERMYPTLERVELFARNKRKGWESWGNQS